MKGSLVPAWESDNSQFHARRRACMTARGRAPERIAVLVVDDVLVGEDLVSAMRNQPVEMVVCPDPAEALLLLGRSCPDAVVVGPAQGRLPVADFIQIARADDPDVPIVVGVGPACRDLAGVAADLGASMVVPRPYRPAEILGLLQALTSGGKRVEVRPMEIDLGRLRIDGAIPQMWLDGRTIGLPPLEFLLLRYFAERRGSVLSREELLSNVWSDRPAARSNTLSVHIARLRKRLGDDEQNPRWIKVVRGIGYQFLVPDTDPSATTGQD